MLKCFSSFELIFGYSTTLELVLGIFELKLSKHSIVVNYSIRWPKKYSNEKTMEYSNHSIVLESIQIKDILII